jgi:hypothetical protein
MSLALISGIAGILGLLLQLTDSFPKHREVRQAAVLLILGFFAGSLAAAATGARIQIEGGIAPSHLLIAALLTISSLLLIAALFTENEGRRSELYGASAVAAGIMCAVFFLVASAWALSGSGYQAITLDEYLALSALSESRGDYDRAIQMTERADSRLEFDDPRKEQLKQRSERLKSLQVTPSPP